MNHASLILRRKFLQSGAAALALAARPFGRSASSDGSRTRKAQIAITLDLEMSRNFPTWDQTHWDYEKGNLDSDTKRYALEAARRVKAHGGVMHFFVVGRTLEQDNVDWLQEIVSMGHVIGNHTYDHVALRATKPEETQLRFRRAPWLIEGKDVREVLVENVRLASAAIKARLGIDGRGFRAPGGFRQGLNDRADLQAMFLELGFRWVSTQYPSHPGTRPGNRPTAETFRGIVDALAATQPFVYPSGLIEIPMSPISDVGAFRSAQWQLDDYISATEMSVAWAIRERAVFDFIAHPSVLCVKDPEFRAIERICELVKQAAERAEITDLDSIARRVA